MSHSYYKEAPPMPADGQVVLQYTLPQQTGEHLDTHTCSTCDIHFTSIEDYLQHKQVQHSVRKQQDFAPSNTVTSKNLDSKKITPLAGNQFQVLQLSKVPHVTQEDVKPAEKTTDGNVVHVQVENIAQVNITDEGSEKIKVGDKPVLLLVQQPSASKLVSQETSALQSSLQTGSNQKKKYKCSVCNRLLKDYSTWKAHKLTHSEQREWVCSWRDCCYAFKTKGSLKRHMRRHTDERPFMCEFCHRTFRESGALTRHLKARTPCTAKTDADFPKYGKSVSFSQNIPAAVNKGIPQELDATTLLPIAQEAGPVPEKTHTSQKRETLSKESHVNYEQPHPMLTSESGNFEEAGNENNQKICHSSEETSLSSQNKQFSLNKLDQDMGKILSAVPNAKQVQVKRVKVVTVIDSNTGKKVKIAIPLSSKIIPIAGSKATTVKEESSANTQSNPDDSIPLLERKDHVSSSSTESSQTISTKINNTARIAGNVDTMSGNKELKAEPVENNISLEEEKCEIESIKFRVDENNVVHKDVEINRETEFEDNDHPDGFAGVTDEYTEETRDGDFTGENSPGEFISDEGDDINDTTVTVMNEDVNYFDLEDSQTSSEIQMSTEVVTSGDFDSDPVTSQSENTEAMDVDLEQGVPLTNKKKCLACDIYTKDEEALKAHLKTHLIPAGYKCPIATCKYIAKEKKRLSLHLKITHHGIIQTPSDNITQDADEAIQEEEQCLVMACDSVDNGPEDTEENFTPDAQATELANVALRQLLELQGNLDTQVLLTSDNQTVGVLHNCPVCERTFTLNYLKLHIRAHTGEKPYACTHCEKKFRTKDTLTKHMSSHSDVRNYKCGECGKMFKRISHAREHLKVHSQERPYFCTLCDKAFKSANGCKVHLRTHSEFLPHECKVCLKRFREKSGLDRHSRTHTGEKPFKCKLCGRGFAEHGTLSRHLKAKVPCTASSKKYLKDNENHIENIQAHLDSLNKLKQDFAMVDHTGQSTSNIPNQVWIDNQVEIEPNDSEEVQNKHTGDISLVIATSNNHTSGGDTVLTEFSTMVTDTQEYIVSQKDIQVMNLTKMADQATGQYAEQSRDRTLIETKYQSTELLNPNAQYIVTSSSNDFISFKNVESSEVITVKPEQLKEVQSLQSNAAIDNSSITVESS